MDRHFNLWLQVICGAVAERVGAVPIFPAFPACMLCKAGAISRRPVLVVGFADVQFQTGTRLGYSVGMVLLFYVLVVSFFGGRLVGRARFSLILPI